MKRTVSLKMRIVLPLIATVLLVSAAIALFLENRPAKAPSDSTQAVERTNDVNIERNATQQSTYEGTRVTVSETFSVKVPNGWNASIADTGNFLALMFSRPEQLGSLVYAADRDPQIDRDGIPAWNGLTEHFFILIPSSGQAFNPSDHANVKQQKFVFDDNHSGQYYQVVKDTEEAKKWGGLLRDKEWYGHTYVYEKNAVRVEAHLAFYPSSTIDKDFYESVVRSIRIE